MSCCKSNYRHGLRGPNGRFLPKNAAVTQKGKTQCKCQSRQKKKLVNHIIFIVDESGSMSSVSNTVNKVYQAQIEKLREESRRTGQATKVTLCVFSDYVKTVYLGQDIFTIPNYHHKYTNMTALCEAVCKTVEEVWTKTTFSKDEDLSFLVNVLTDGKENASIQMYRNLMPRLIREKQALGNWTFTFSLPPGYKQRFCNDYEVPPDNVQEWEGTNDGLETSSIQTCSGLSNYYAARSSGVRSVDKFYLTTDLSNISQKDFKNLTDLSNKCRFLSVEKECDIQTFVQAKLGYYLPGIAYYALTKKENIAPNKDILIVEKSTKRVFGGSEARNLLGLPENQIARVTPGNHNKWDIYVKSLSRNRILVRGTKIIIL